MDHARRMDLFWGCFPEGLLFLGRNLLEYIDRSGA